MEKYIVIRGVIATRLVHNEKNTVFSQTNPQIKMHLKQRFFIV